MNSSIINIHISNLRIALVGISYNLNVKRELSPDIIESVKEQAATALSDLASLERQIDNRVFEDRALREELANIGQAIHRIVSPPMRDTGIAAKTPAPSTGTATANYESDGEGYDVSTNTPQD